MLTGKRNGATHSLVSGLATALNINRNGPRQERGLSHQSVQLKSQFGDD